MMHQIDDKYIHYKDNAGAKSFEMSFKTFGGKLSCPVLNLSEISLTNSVPDFSGCVS